MTTNTYTNDLPGFIENMKNVQKEAEIKGHKGVSQMASFAWKMAEEFKAKGEPLEGGE